MIFDRAEGTGQRAEDRLSPLFSALSPKPSALISAGDCQC